MTKKKIRIALLLDSLENAAWKWELMNILRTSDYTEIACIIVGSDAPTDERLPKMEGGGLKYLLYNLFKKFETRRFHPKPDAFKLSRQGEMYASIPTVPAQLFPDGHCSGAAIEVIKKYSPDLILSLGLRIPRGEILRQFPYGVWSFEIDAASPTGFWEFLEGKATTPGVLYKLEEPLTESKAIYRSYSPTDRLSVVISRSRKQWKDLNFVPRVLQSLYESGANGLHQRLRHQTPLLTTHPVSKAPTNKNLLVPLAKHALRMVARKFHRTLSFDQWILLFGRHDQSSTDLTKFEKLIPPKDTVWADPFVIFKDNRYFIFIEECPRKPKRGRISLLVMSENGKCSPPRTILERPYHLSYPFLFEWQNDLYMIPESSENKTVELYRCRDFPYEWEFKKNLMTGVEAVDSTLLLYRDGLWWLFTTIRENSGYPNWEELFLFSAETPLSEEWTPHPMNPVISDVTRARPAGKIFERNGDLYRPSQDCSRRYGYGIRINRIVTLNRSEYCEEEVSFIEPLWDSNIEGVHTINQDGKITFIDALYRRTR